VIERWSRDRFSEVNGRGPLREEMACRILDQIISGLEHMHLNTTCHRDIKLKNIMLSGMDSDLRVAIADFGLSKRFRQGEQLRDVCGTLHYNSPELLCGPNDLVQNDIWALGVVLHAMLSGYLPFDLPEDSTNQRWLTERIADARYFVMPATVSRAARDLVESILKVDQAERATHCDCARARSRARVCRQQHRPHTRRRCRRNRSPLNSLSLNLNLSSHTVTHTHN
jgi:serine/threonine protein kinase